VLVSNRRTGPAFDTVLQPAIEYAQNGFPITEEILAVIYIAKDRKIYQLNASGRAPSGETLDDIGGARI
jgi:gamma-glutamyltranspeptidase